MIRGCMHPNAYVSIFMLYALLHAAWPHAMCQWRSCRRPLQKVTLPTGKQCIKRLHKPATKETPAPLGTLAHTTLQPPYAISSRTSL